MARLKDILGINARSAEYLSLNKKSARRVADDKLLTKTMLVKAKIPHPRLLAKLSNHKEVDEFDFKSVEGGFVIKPSQGLEGGGILVVRKKVVNAHKEERLKWITMDGTVLNEGDLRVWCLDIVEGRYSRRNIPDSALVEERVKNHPSFRKMGVVGTPDLRVLVFNGVPVMAMLRLPTEESKGRANLHQGAIGLGVDMATGITTFGTYKGGRIKSLPEINKKVNGIVIPNWREALLLAVRTQMKSKLVYVAVDMLIDEDRGPLVLELNDQPGLSIQLANMAGLKKRLDRVEGLEVDNAEQGVNICQALFASRFAKRVRRITQGKVVVSAFETVRVQTLVQKGKKKKIVELRAKMDTGAYTTSIEREEAAKLNLLGEGNILWEKKFKSALGEQHREVVRLVYWMAGRKVVTRAAVADRTGLRYKLLIGRRDLKGFLIDPRKFRKRKKDKK